LTTGRFGIKIYAFLHGYIDNHYTETAAKKSIAMTKIISIVGKSNTGKTTLLEKLIPELKRRGHRIGAVKHASSGFNMDKAGKDSWRHKAAGADTVFVISPDQVAMITDATANSLDMVARYASDLDLIITEGFKTENKPKIEVVRRERSEQPLCSKDPRLLAFVSDVDIDTALPVFGLSDITALADFIEKRFFKKC